MPITPCGYAVGTGIFTPAEIQQMQAGITETINRIARGFLTPYETSCPELHFAERLEGIAHQDRAYAVALIHGVFADAHRRALLRARPAMSSFWIGFCRIVPCSIRRPRSAGAW